MSDLLIDAQSLAARLPSADSLVFDVRHDLADHAVGRRAYTEGHIPGAIYLDHELELSGLKTGKNGRHPLPDRQQFAQFMGSLGLRPDRQVVVYDAGSSLYSAHVWWMLRWIGHDKVVVLDGGWAAWLAAGGAIERGATVQASQAVGGDVGCSAHQTMPVVDAQAVLANLDKPVFTVLDARVENRFRGEVEPMDPVAGHIPGALNYPNSLVVQEDGRFKPAEVLRQDFDRLLQGRAPQNIVHQCGSGIAACHNLFAMELAGLSGSALYAGSWSEWCSDPARPVGRG
ncbi:sulfurtransferase [Alcaligenaceae bacterium]|nr:sulfurtransferase [Alcaligenaceae bacterium]